MSDFFEKTFKSKKILVTGHTGFKGSWMTLWLLKMGAKVSGFSLEPDQNPSLFNTLKIQNDINHYIGDIRNESQLLSVLQKEQPEIVFHMAAQPLVRRSYREPKYTYETNIMGTVNLLEAVRQTNSVSTVVNITTDKCYENKEWVYGYRETDPLGGYDPYSASKAGAEIVTSSYRSSFFNPHAYGSTHYLALASARAGNVIGGGDWSEDRLIPDCIKAIQNQETILIRSPYSTRPWQHVLEPLRGYLHLAAKMLEDPVKYSEAWNFGPLDSASIPVELLVDKIIKFWGAGAYHVDNRDQPHEAHLLKLDLSKSNHKLGFAPKLSIDEALKMTVDWYKNFYSPAHPPKDFTLKQIEKYSS